MKLCAMIFCGISFTQEKFSDVRTFYATISQSTVVRKYTNILFFYRTALFLAYGPCIK